MIAMAGGPVTFLLTIVIAILDGLGTLIVPIVSWLMSQRMNLNHSTPARTHSISGLKS